MEQSGRPLRPPDRNGNAWFAGWDARERIDRELIDRELINRELIDRELINRERETRFELATFSLEG